MNFDFLLALSLILSGFLFLLVVLLALSLTLSKLGHNLWSSYVRSRELVFTPLILQAMASEGPSRLAQELEERRRPADWTIVEESLLRWSHSLSGFGQRRLCELFEECGFAAVERKRLMSLRWWTRARAAQRLGEMMSKSAEGDLIAALDDGEVEVRLIAAWALGRIGDPKAVSELLPHLAHDSKLAALRVSSAVAAIGPSSIPLLENLLESGDPGVVSLAISLLGGFQDRRAVDAVMGFLKHPDMDLRIAACRALGQISDERAWPGVVERLEDDRWQVRAAAALVCGQAKIEPAVAALKRSLGDRAWWVRLNGGQALSELGPAGRKALEEALSSPDRFARDMAGQWLNEAEARS